MLPRKRLYTKNDEVASTSLNISLPEKMKIFIEGKVSQKIYTSASEYIRELVRDRMDAEEIGQRREAIAAEALGAGKQGSSREVANLIETLDLFEAGIKLTEERLQRKYPKASKEEISKLVTDWLRSHDTAPQGDGLGVPASPARMRRLRINRAR